MKDPTNPREVFDWMMKYYIIALKSVECAIFDGPKRMMRIGVHLEEAMWDEFLRMESVVEELKAHFSDPREQLTAIVTAFEARIRMIDYSNSLVDEPGLSIEGLLFGQGYDSRDRKQVRDVFSHIVGITKLSIHHYENDENYQFNYRKLDEEFSASLKPSKEKLESLAVAEELSIDEEDIEPEQ